MSQNLVDDIFTQVMQMDPTDRVALLKRLLDQVDEHDLPPDAELDLVWSPEWDQRRERRLAAGDAYLVDADEAMQRVRTSLPPRE